MGFERDVCVVGGCGRVGLPIGLVFAEAGLKVSIFDINAEAVEKVKQRQMPFFERGAQELLSELDEEAFLVSSDPTEISRCRSVIVIIGTPVDEHLNPNYSTFSKFLSDLFPHLRDGQLLVLRSTVYPGTTARAAELVEQQGLKIDVSFCPERVAEGKSLEESKSLPQIVSGMTASARTRAEELFRVLNPEIIHLTPAEAELAKLFTNSWRYIQFATANQFYMIAEERGLDFYKIYNAMRHKYPRTEGFPGAGLAAGPCLFKDTMQLAAFSSNNFFLGHSAMLINEGLPGFVVSQLKKQHDLSRMTVGVLGMAFKGNIDDPRSSLSYKLKKLLEFSCREVLCTDPFVKDPRLVPLERVLAEADILLLGAPHANYKNLTFPEDKIVVDIWNYWEAAQRPDSLTKDAK